MSATDTRRVPPGLVELGGLARTLNIRLGGFDLSLLEGASQVLLSPGVSLEEPIASQARARGIEVLGDIGPRAQQLTSDTYRVARGHKACVPPSVDLCWGVAERTAFGASEYVEAHRQRHDQRDRGRETMAK